MKKTVELQGKKYNREELENEIYKILSEKYYDTVKSMEGMENSWKKLITLDGQITEPMSQNSSLQGDEIENTVITEIYGWNMTDFEGINFIEKNLTENDDWEEYAETYEEYKKISTEYDYINFDKDLFTYEDLLSELAWCYNENDDKNGEIEELLNELFQE